MSIGNSLVEILTQKIVQDIEAEILKLKFGQDFNFRFSQDADVFLVEILKLMLNRDSVI